LNYTINFNVKPIIYLQPTLADFAVLCNNSIIFKTKEEGKMQLEKGDHCPFKDCRGVLRLDKCSGKSVVACDCHPTSHFTPIAPQQAAAWERGELVDIEFDTPADDDHWYRDLVLSQSQRVA